MRCCGLMRYYQPFPAAIPQCEAGYPRVTHPSATKLSSIRKYHLTPFDLHVLGTPPAFILSQDQTLMLKFYVSSETFKILIRKKFSRSKWTWLSIFILLLNRVVRIPGSSPFASPLRFRSPKLVTIHVLLNFLIHHVVHGTVS